MRETHVAIVGAGPYGLAAAAHLRRAGVEVAVFGDPMAFWRGMPAGMYLRSNFEATNIAERHGPLSLASYQRETGDSFGAPVPLDRFIDYGDWVQRQAVPDVDRRFVTRIQRDGEGFLLELQHGARIAARRVVVACGIERFAWRPPELAHLPRELASHTGDHADLSVFAARDVAVVGGGQSALESAALAHEAGARVALFARRPRIVWLRGHSVKKRIGRLGPLVYAPTDVGPLWYSRLVAYPRLFTTLPRSTQARIARRCIRPAGSHWLIERLQDVGLQLGRAVTSAQPAGSRLRITLDDGAERTVDHLLLGTGYRVDVARYPFLSPPLLMQLRRMDGYPVLGPGLESSVPGLHFLGAPAACSFGPIMRFVSGTWYSSRALVRAVAGDAAARPSVHSMSTAGPARVRRAGAWGDD
jgi:hypothetical protein